MSLRYVRPTVPPPASLCFSYLVVSLTPVADMPLQHIDFGILLSFHGLNLTRLFAFEQQYLHFLEIYASQELFLPWLQEVMQPREDKKHL